MTSTLHRCVFPDDDARLAPLYVRSADGASRVVSRTAVAIAPRGLTSFGTYFSAFPASYWKHDTTVREVTFCVTTEGSGTIVLMRSDAQGRADVEAEIEVDGGTTRRTVALDGFDEGGWLWFEGRAGAGGLTVRDAVWETEAQPRRRPCATVGITTFDKPDYCVATLEAIGSEPELVASLERILIVDQGTRVVADQAGYAAAAALLGDRVRVVRQPNLGGSGGYARAMAETLATTESPFLLLMDDDVRVEPESIRRSIVFGAFCAAPTIVGGHMLDLHHPTTLYAWAEVVDRVPFMWRPLHDDVMPVDFADSDLRTTPLLHQRMEADYNGWWMSLIPRELIERVGLAIPVFIKWDDAEYGLRAAEAGVHTVTLPGAALWHVSWADKDDHVDWQAYFHARNRLVVALLHSPHPRGGTVLVHSRRADLKHLFAMQYYPVALRHRAIRAVLSGPDHLHDQLARALPAARELGARFSETVAAPDGIAADSRIDATDMPSGNRLRIFMARSIAAQWLRRPRRSAAGRTEVEAHAGEAKWWRLARYDSALIQMAGSSEKRLYVRDRSSFRHFLADSIRLHRRLRREWPALSATYRAADLTSVARWTETFDRAGSQGGLS